MSFDRYASAKEALMDMACDTQELFDPVECWSCSRRLERDEAWLAQTEKYCGIFADIWLCAECA